MLTLGLLVKSLALSRPAELRSPIDPAHSANLTLYHVNPKGFGWDPINMNTGDAAGDFFFDMHNVYLLPYECPRGAASGHGCSNPEADAPDLVVNKITMTVDNRYSGYARCNIGVNGSDGHGHPCHDGVYCCYCSDPENPWGPAVPCNRTVGRENVKDHFGSTSRYNQCEQHMPDYECWRANLAKKYTDADPGYWYSSLKDGYCGSTGNTDCTWSASLIKIVDKHCHDHTLWGEIKKYDTSGCFNSCPGAFNISDPCQVKCFYSTVLGPDASKPGGQVTGIPLDKLVAAWDVPFHDEADGGCPSIVPSGQQRVR